MSRIKKQILNKLKEYANKMGRDHLGGDDYTSKKKGGLRDFDGYDNVDYNKDMPMDEATLSTIHKAAKKGSYPVSLVVIEKDKVVKQELVKTPMAVPAAFNVLRKKYPKNKYRINIESRTGKILFKEDSPASSHPLGKKEVTQGVKVIEMLDVIAHWMFGPDYHKLTTKQKKDVHKEAIRGKIIKQTPFKESKFAKKPEVTPQQLLKIQNDVRKVNRKIKVYISKHPVTKGQLDIELGHGHDNDAEIHKIYAILKKHTGSWRTGTMFNESVNEGPIDRVIGGRPYKYVGDGRKGKAIVSGPMKDREKGDIIKRAKKAGYIAKPNMGGGVTIFIESVNEDKFYNTRVQYTDPKSKKKFVGDVVRKDGDEYKVNLGKDGRFEKYILAKAKDLKIVSKSKKRTYESVNEVKVNYNFSEEELKRVLKLLGRSASTEVKMIKAFEKAFGRKLTRDELFESLNEGMFSTIDQIRQDSKDVRDFVKNVFKDSDFRKLKNDKEFLKYLKSIYEGVDESKGVPSNYMQGRTSDYHTALRGKNRDYSGGTNFKKKNHGQPDVEEEDEDQETNHLSNKQTHIKSDKLKVSEGFDKIEHLSLLNKALKAIPGSQKQKEIIRKLNVVRKAGGMRPLKEQSIVEYGQRLDLSFIEDEEARLKGTPKSKDAINRDIDETAKRDYKAEYKKFQSSTKAKKYRAELNKYNRDKGTYGNGDGKDASHKGGKIVGFESASKNRGRKEKSRLKKK